MSTHFCTVCDNMLSYASEHEKTIKKCRVCSETFDISPEDTLRYQKNKSGDIATREVELMSAERDPTNKKIRCECKKCGHGFARMVRTADLKTYVKCIKCGIINPYLNELF